MSWDWFPNEGKWSLKGEKEVGFRVQFKCQHALWKGTHFENQWQGGGAAGNYS